MYGKCSELTDSQVSIAYISDTANLWWDHRVKMQEMHESGLLAQKAKSALSVEEHVL